MTAMNRLHSARTSYGFRQVNGSEVDEFSGGYRSGGHGDVVVREPWWQDTAAFLPVEEFLLLDGTVTADVTVSRDSWLPSTIANTLFVVEAGGSLNGAGPMLTMGLPNVHTTNTLSNYIALKVREEMILLEKVDKYFVDGLAAARENRMRDAYSGVLGGLDVLMKGAMWVRISQRLRELSVPDLPVAVGIGAMRFTSSVEQQVPDWRLILGELVEVAKHQRVDVATAFRGLIESYGAASSSSRKLPDEHRRHSY